MARFMRELAERAQHTSVVELHCTMLETLAARVGCDSAILVPALDRSLAPSEINKRGYLHLLRQFARDRARYVPGMHKGRVVFDRQLAYRDSEVYTLSERQRLPFYVDIVQPQRISSLLIGDLRFRGVTRGTLHFCRHGRRSDFRPAAVELLRRALPFLGVVERAVALAEEAAAMQAAAVALGRRERDVARLASRGLATKEIAAALGTSAATVRNQLTAIYRKLDVSNRAELAFMFGSGGG